MTPALLLLQGAAAAASLFGYLILARGAFGTGTQLTLGEGFTLMSIAAVYGWWLAPVTAAATGIRGAFLGLVILDLLWAFLAQGLAGFAFCALAFCPDFAPYGDLARYGSLLFGAAAAWTAWRAYRAATGPTQWAVPVTAIVLSVFSFALQAVNTKFPY